MDLIPALYNFFVNIAFNIYIENIYMREETKCGLTHPASQNLFKIFLLCCIIIYMSIFLNFYIYIYVRICT